MSSLSAAQPGSHTFRMGEVSERPSRRRLEWSVVPRRLLAIAVAVAAIASGCGGSEEEATPVAETVVETITPAGRTAAPKLTGATLGGEQISLGDFRGRPVLINVWSSW